jgi:cysteine desulfurase/selenocysteine lyase
VNRSDFPILNGPEPLTYLDSAATTQKPRVVIDAISNFYETANANVHRGAHRLSTLATERYEAARERVRQFVNAASTEEIVFTRGTTESINLVANVLRGQLAPGDEILISHLEHHSNIVPWQMLAAASGAKLVACNVTEAGDIDIDDFSARLGERTRIVAVGHVSNALGTINPVEQLVDLARRAGALSVLDGAQAIAHLPVDVRELGCDFYAFSGHKVYGPTGIGVLYGRRELLDALPPWQGGGEMIEHVTIERSSYNRLPYKFEAGTPNIAGAIGLAAALEYLSAVNREELEAHEAQVLSSCVAALKQMPELRLVGEPERRTGVVSFLVDGAHPHDIGTLLDKQGVAVRTGHHCAMPLMEHLGLPGTVRASFAMYNTVEDVDTLVASLRKAISFL